MQNITELTQPPVVGKRYWVYCARTKIKSWSNIGCDKRHPYWTKRSIPLLGDFHWDIEIIGFPNEHCHIDFRFLNTREFSRLTMGGIPPHSQVISLENIVEFHWEIRRCNRPMPQFLPLSLISWGTALESAYKDSQVCCGKCPHKGIDLNLIEPDELGNKTCPAHGLKWNKEGFLIRQTI